MLKDQKELLSVFNAHSVDYLVVGGHAAIAYGVARLTKDLDIWIRPSESNSINVFRALAEFGAPLQDVSAANFIDRPNEVLQLGVAPNRIDILQSISALSFDDAWANRMDFAIDDDIVAHYLSLDDLIQNKQFVGRLRDLADIDELRKMRKLS
jgi:hypothetical protein